MKCVYIRIGEFLAQLALSTPLYEKHAADIFEEFPDTDESIRAAATIAVKFAFALATNDKEKSEGTPRKTGSAEGLRRR